MGIEFGVAVTTTTESWKVVRRAESMGFSFAWFYDTQLLNPDVFIGMTQAAMNTSRINLATGVLIPSNRIEPVTANCFATLNQIAPGRIHFGVGTGFTGRRTMGLRAIRLARLRRYVETVRALLLGETVTWDFEGMSREIAFLNPDKEMINLKDDVPVHISALGPKTRSLVAELNAGWINFGSEEAGVTKALDDMRGKWQGAGRDLESLYASLFSLGCVLADDEAPDSERARAQAGPYVSVFFHNLVETTEPGSMEDVLGKKLSGMLEQYREVYEGYPENERHLRNHRGHLMFVRRDEQHLVTGELIQALTFTGRKDELKERVKRLEEAGYNQFVIQLVEGYDDAIEDWAEVFGL